MTRHLLFYRDFRGYSGGHGKVWDYFRHANAHPAWEASAFFTPDSIHQTNPWQAVPTLIQASWMPERAAALFLGGLDWQAYPVDDPARPVLNLVQSVCHSDADDERYPFLSRRAIRICVSQVIADAICATGRVNGPVRAIPAALDLATFPDAALAPRGIFIDATKQPGEPLGRGLYQRLREQGREVTLVERIMPRAEYLAELARCRVAVLLPLPTEGFYLPGLESMALGCAVVVPDCVGNREYLLPGINALTPAAELEALLDAVHCLDDEPFAAALVAAGLDTAAKHDLMRERAAFHAILDELDSLWLS